MDILYRPGEPRSVHSFRVSDETWNKAKERADGERVTRSHVINMLLEGYGDGLINLPPEEPT